MMLTKCSYLFFLVLCFHCKIFYNFYIVLGNFLYCLSLLLCMNINFIKKTVGPFFEKKSLTDNKEVLTKGQGHVERL